MIHFLVFSFLMFPGKTHPVRGYMNRIQQLQQESPLYHTGTTVVIHMSNEKLCIKFTVIYLKGQTLLEMKGKICLRILFNNEILNVTIKKPKPTTPQKNKQVDCPFTVTFTFLIFFSFQL